MFQDLLGKYMEETKKRDKRKSENKKKQNSLEFFAKFYRIIDTHIICCVNTPSLKIFPCNWAIISKKSIGGVVKFFNI